MGIFCLCFSLKYNIDVLIQLFVLPSNRSFEVVLLQKRFFDILILKILIIKALLNDHTVLVVNRLSTVTTKWSSASTGSYQLFFRESVGLCKLKFIQNKIRVCLNVQQSFISLSYWRNKSKEKCFQEMLCLIQDQGMISSATRKLPLESRKNLRIPYFSTQSSLEHGTLEEIWVQKDRRYRSRSDKALRNKGIEEHLHKLGLELGK